MLSLTGYQKKVLVILPLLNFVNYLDRQIIYPLFPLIAGDFGLNFTQCGLLVTAFSVVHSLGTLPLGALADRTSRKKVISYGILFWSGATFLSGIAASFRSLVVARGLVGIGEAAYTPAATAIITGSFSRRVRARVQGVFDLGTFVGGAAGIVLGGLVASWAGWRPAFFIVGLPGLFLGLAVRRLPEVPRAAQEARFPIGLLLRVPAYVMVLVSGWLITFAGHAYIIWGTTFVSRYKGLTLGQAAISMGAIAVASGVLGVMAGAALADRLARVYVWGRVLTICLGFLISAPLIYYALHTPAKALYLGAFGLGTFFMTWYHGPVTATIHDLIPPRAHATAMGMYYFFVNMMGTILAGSLIGPIADRYGLLAGMHTALVAQVAGGFSFLLVIYLIRRHGIHHPRLAAYSVEQVTVGIADAKCAGLMGASPSPAGA